jgi:hypothetical protein
MIHEKNLKKNLMTLFPKNEASICTAYCLGEANTE